MGVIEPLRKERRDILKNFKVNSSELDAIQANANKYAGGDLSKWVRYAAQNMRPSKKLIAKDVEKFDQPT